jgi:2-methylcitrate dehydratase PrpD
MSDSTRPAPDAVLVDIASYVCDQEIKSDLAFETAFYCLMDSLACGFQALRYPACTNLLGPVVPGATMNGGARVPGTFAPFGVTVAGSIGPSSLVQAGYSSASRPQPRVSIRQ